MTVKITNPWTGQVDYSYDYMDATDVEIVVAKSASAFPAWSALSLQQRGEILRRVATVMRLKKEQIANIMSSEMGKLHNEALAEIEKSAGAIE